MCESCIFEPSSCVKFYIVWCLSFGGGFTLCGLARGVNALIVYRGEPKFLIDGLLNLLAGLAGLTYFIAGVLFLLGVRNEKKKLFRVGQILSYIFPILFFYLIFTLVIHILAILKIIEYMKETWGQ